MSSIRTVAFIGLGIMGRPMAANLGPMLTGAARAQGDGGLDHSALIRVIQRLTGQQP